HLAKPEPAVLRREIHDREAEAPRLRDHADRTGLVIEAENRTEARENTVGDVDHALAVGTDHADVVLARDRRELPLEIDAVTSDFGKTRAEYDHVRHAFGAALLEHVGD